jgi:hypothetical protein
MKLNDKEDGGVKPVSLAAAQRLAEQLDTRTPRGNSSLGTDHQGCVIDD